MTRPVPEQLVSARFVLTPLCVEHTAEMVRVRAHFDSHECRQGVRSGRHERDPVQGCDWRHSVARLIYSTIASLDGYVADEHEDFGWSAPDEEVHAFINDLQRPIGTYLYGRRLYEVMAVWDRLPLPNESPAVCDFAQIWRAADKIVYSTTLETTRSARTRIAREFDPEAVRALKTTANRDISVGGPGLAGHAIRAGLVDEVEFFTVPVLVGAGTKAFPEGVRMGLELLDEFCSANGWSSGSAHRKALRN